MTTDGHDEPGGLPRVEYPAANGTAPEAVPLAWSAPTYRRHAGETLEHPRQVLRDRAWPYEPASCLPGLRVVALRVSDEEFVCPLCGLRTS